MSNGDFKYIWRCVKCSNHFANILYAEGYLKQEKKCPKCKSLNLLTMSNSEISVICKYPNSNVSDYGDCEH
jgi:phage FluMu protein Com